MNENGIGSHMLQYSTQEARECVKWEGGVEGCFSGELVRVGVWGGHTDRGRPGM